MTTQPATPLSELNPHDTLYPFAERFRASTSGTDSVNIWNIPARTIITMVLARVVRAGVGASGGNLTIGDDDDGDGYILAANLCGATVGTIYGDNTTERGLYLKTNTSVETHAGKWKVYGSAGKELKLDCSAELTTEAIVDIFVFGYRYAA